MEAQAGRGPLPLISALPRAVRAVQSPGAMRWARRRATARLLRGPKSRKTIQNPLRCAQLGSWTRPVPRPTGAHAAGDQSQWRCPHGPETWLVWYGRLDQGCEEPTGAAVPSQ
eukprot:scaffold4827_cov109-Isochrysis_galbana.AAC.23